MSSKQQTLKGFRDIMPEEAVIRQKVITILRKTFESFGFQPIETPSLEYAQILLNKYGQETDKLVYTFKDLGERKIGLRYDLTVPVARFLASHQNEINYPFKRYQIQNVYRAEKPQRNRYREFTQCDIDIFGLASPLADAEIILIVYTALKKLGFDKFSIEINDRKLLSQLFNQIKITDNKQQMSILQSIDKLDKKSKKTVAEELKSKGFAPELIKKVFRKLDKLTPNDNLNLIFKFLQKSGVKENYYQFNPSLVRGLDYYTGPVFEAVVTKPNIGSIGGGGRYDNLVSQIGGPDITGTGFSYGLERLVEVIRSQNLWPELNTSLTKVLVTVFSSELKEKSFKTAQELRKNKLNTEVYLDTDERLDKQLQYANQKKIPWVVIIGPEEDKKDVVALKNMSSGKQKTLSIKEAIFKLQK